MLEFLITHLFDNIGKTRFVHLEHLATMRAFDLVHSSFPSYRITRMIYRSRPGSTLSSPSPIGASTDFVPIDVRLSTTLTASLYSYEHTKSGGSQNKPKPNRVLMKNEPNRYDPARRDLRQTGRLEAFRLLSCESHYERFHVLRIQFFSSPSSTSRSFETSRCSRLKRLASWRSSSVATLFSSGLLSTICGNGIPIS